MRVLYVSTGSTPHDRRFLGAMAERLDATAWLCLDPGCSTDLEQTSPTGVRVILPPPSHQRFSPMDLVAMTHTIRRAASELRVDVVHAGPVPTAGLAAVRAAAGPTVVMAWGSDVLLAPTGPRAVVDAVAEALGGASGFVGDARCVEDAASLLGLPASTPRAVFPWGVEAFARAEPKADSPLRRRLGWAGAHVCVSARAWIPAYRVDVLLDAFDQAHRDDPLLRLALLGDGEEAPLVRARTRAWTADGSVVCPGRIGPLDVREWFEAADLYVSTVPSDGSSVSLLEAMAAARPAVVPDAFGNREWVEPGRTGWRVPPGNPVALADAISQAFRSTATLPRMGRCARSVVLERANWERNVAALFRLYEAVA